MTNEKAIFGLEGLVYKKRGAWADPVYIYKGASINSNDLWDDLWDQFMESEETITVAARIEKWRESLNQEEILKETRLESIFELAKKFPVSHDLAIHEDFLTAAGEEIFPDCQTRHDLIEKLRWAGADELCKVIATARIGKGETYNDSLKIMSLSEFMDENGISFHDIYPISTYAPQSNIVALRFWEQDAAAGFKSDDQAFNDWFKDNKDRAAAYIEDSVYALYEAKEQDLKSKHIEIKLEWNPKEKGIVADFIDKSTGVIIWCSNDWKKPCGYQAVSDSLDDVKNDNEEILSAITAIEKIVKHLPKKDAFRFDEINVVPDSKYPENLHELEITFTVNGKSHKILPDAINNPNHIKYKETAKLIETITAASKQPVISK